MSKQVEFTTRDNVTIQSLARDQDHIQNACNPRAVIRSLHVLLHELDELGEFKNGHESITNHPLMVATVDKLRDMFGVEFLGNKSLDAHSRVAEIARS